VEVPYQVDVPYPVAEACQEGVPYLGVAAYRVAAYRVEAYWRLVERAAELEEASSHAGNHPEEMAVLLLLQTLSMPAEFSENGDNSRPLKPGGGGAPKGT
jgi:hypothetical protein